jgi:hypothetical protein
MSIEVSVEMIRLLDILAHCPDGAIHYELVAQEVRSSLIYQAVMLGLVYAMQEPAQTVYRFKILPAGMELLGVQE